MISWSISLCHSFFLYTQPVPPHGLVNDKVMSLRTRYIPELAYALAFSSISVHLLWQRRAAETDRRHYSARLSILDELAARLRTGEAVSDAEVARLRRLAETVAEVTHPGERIGWREVLFGRKESGIERQGKEELERRELDRVQSELRLADDITQRS
ncbi:hypothetical protein F5148DRAFT_326014 [Russula earlei]|uniref:Uncharacterized protein n=1 Tax=Russula earlei TaxID=71964 RepID=A0ACC0UIJ5_9AGAM|nr:hypothetical protein F5148DRAFT_326014 [Russula earlei]